MRVPGVLFEEAPLVQPNRVMRVHNKGYYESIVLSEPDEGLSQLDPDTFVSKGTINAILRGAGAACLAIDRVMAKEAYNVFCPVRPPGHHAEADKAMGFCIFNNIAIAAMHALNHHRLEKIAIVDFDVHHGNGTQAIFEKEGRVNYYSTHQRSLFPDTGYPDETGVGNIYNYQLTPNADGPLFRQIFRDTILKSLRTTRPNLILISAGFDAHRLDPLAQVNLEADDYYWVTRELCTVAADHSQGRIVSMLEGGYNLEALDDGVFQHVSALSESAQDRNIGV